MKFTFAKAVVLIALGVLQLQGCSTIEALTGGGDAYLELNKDVFYKFSGKVCLDEKCFQGAGVLPNNPEQYIIDFHASRADFVKIKGCNRTRQLTDEGSHFRFKMTHNDVESDEITCKLRANAFDYRRQLHSFYFVAFEKDEFKLPFKTICDGYTFKRNGIGVCQIGKGQIGKLKFEKKVKIFKGKRCDIDFEYAHGKKVELGRDFRFRQRKHGEYTCGFAEVDPPHRRGHVFILVYEQEIFPKENK